MNPEVRAYGHLASPAPDQGMRSAAGLLILLLTCAFQHIEGVEAQHVCGAGL